jgi:hypothetical protein
MYSTTEIFTQENTVVTHETIQKYVHVYQYCQYMQLHNL